MGGSLSGGSVRILWDADDSAEVTITGGVSSWTVNGSAVTFPYTLSSSTTFETAHSGTYTVSVQHHGHEVANTPDGTREVELRFGEQAVFEPTVDDTGGGQWMADLHRELSATYAPRSVRILNGDTENALLALGTGQAVTHQGNDHFLVTIAPHGVSNTITTTSADAGAIGFNIGQWVLRATDGASDITRTREVANIEHDFIQLEQIGGTATFNKVVSSRFRFAIPKTGVTIVDSKGIDFVVPNASDVTGAVTNYIAMNIPALTGGGGTNFYGIRFNNEPSGGSIVSVNNDLVLKALTAATSVRIVGGPGSSGSVKLQPGSGATVIAGGAAGALGSMELAPSVNVSGVRSRLVYGTDDTGWKFGIAKNVAGTVTDLLTILDQGDVAITRGLGVFGVTPPTARPTVSGSQGGNAALASLLTALAATGLITDGTTA